jgi:putative hydrolase
MKFLLDIHCHTIASGHAYSTIQEMAKHAADIGFEAVGMTDHGPAMPGGAHLFHFVNLHCLPEEMYGVRVLKGAEANIIDHQGGLDLDDKVLKRLDIVIASFHLPCIDPGTIEQNTNTLIKIAQNPHVDVIGHPGNPHYPINIKEVVRAAKENNTLIEINNSSLRPIGSRTGSKENCYEILKECRDQGVMVLLGSDAHVSFEIGKFDKVEQMIKDLNVPEELIANTSLEKLKSYIKL